MSIVQTKNVKKTLINLSLLLISASCSIIGAEMILRMLGYQPWQFEIHENEPTMHEYNSTLGWRNKAGQYKFAPYHPDVSKIQMTLLEMGLRKTHEHQSNIRDNRPKIIFVGGSYTQGFAISDYETYPWKVQKHFPSFEVLNYGTAGHGTYQSLLTLEQNLPVLHDPKIVLYGFIPHHEVRNVAPATWLAGLFKWSSRAHIFLPYATVDNNNALIRHQPEAYIALPFREKLAIISLVERTIMNAKTYRRYDQKRLVTESILLQMQKLTVRHGARFLVVILKASQKTKTHYKRFLESNGTMTIDCAYPIGEKMRVKGEGHPNGDMNSKWASCIVDFMYEHRAEYGLSDGSLLTSLSS